LLANPEIIGNNIFTGAEMVSATDIINALSQEVSPGSASATPPPATHATDPAPAYVTDTVTDPFASSAFAILQTPPGTKYAYHCLEQHHPRNSQWILSEGTCCCFMSLLFHI